MLGLNKARPTYSEATSVSFPTDQTSLVSDSVVPLDSSSSSFCSKSMPTLFFADQTSLVSDSVVPLDSSSSSGLDTAGSSQGALGGTHALGSVTRAAADSPAQEATSARDVAAAPADGEADDIPMYTLGSDDEDDLAVVSSVEQAREAQVNNAATAFFCSRQYGIYRKRVAHATGISSSCVTCYVVPKPATEHVTQRYSALETLSE